MPEPAGSTRTVNLDPGSGGVSFPRLLFALLRQRFTGTVTIQQAMPPGARTIWVRGGMPVFTDWSSSEDLLGEQLLHAGLIDTQGLVRGLEAMHAGKGLLGAILLELGLIDDKQRSEALREQCSSKLVHLFAPDALASPAIEVTAVEHGKGKGDELAQVNVLALILRGVEDHYGEAQVGAEIGSGLSGDLVATPALVRYERQFDFEAEDAPILAALGRGVTFDGMLGPNVDRSRALNVVYTLWCCQMLRVGDDAVQAIAKGATAAAAGHQLGASLSATGKTRSSRSASASGSRTKLAKASAGASASASTGASASASTGASASASTGASASASTGASASASTSAPSAKPPPSSAKPPPSSAKPPPPPSAKPPPPSVKPPPPPRKAAAEADEGLAAFEATLAELEAKVAAEANAFVLFGLEIDADRKQIREVWANLSKTFHPDALEGLGRGHLHDRVEPVFAALSEAYGVLGNKDEREKLRAALEAGGKNLKAGDDAAVIVRNAFEAEIMGRDGEKLLRANQYQRALEIFERAHALSPKDPDIEASLHYARLQAGDPSSVDASTTVGRLAKLLESAPNCSKANYYKAMIHLRLGEIGPAKTSFYEAFRLDPRNIDAQRQLRALGLKEREAAGKLDGGGKKGDDKKRGFGLRDLFGKK